MSDPAEMPAAPRANVGAAAGGGASVAASPTGDWQKTAEALLDKIVNQLVTLRVTTIIADGHVDSANAADINAATLITVTSPPEQQVVAQTAINMALGDMTQVMHPDFTSKPDLAKLHQDAITLGRQLRSDSISVLTTLMKDAAGWVEGWNKSTKG